MGVMAELIQIINAYRAEHVPILSVDVPSGLDADTGIPAGTEAVRADVTVALLGLKPGYLTLAAQQFLGDCLVAGIGAPRRLIERIGRPMGGTPEVGGLDAGLDGGEGETG
jgi:NAD(P)H-hydrate epimerase